MFVIFRSVSSASDLLNGVRSEDPPGKRCGRDTVDDDHFKFLIFARALMTGGNKM